MKTNIECESLTNNTDWLPDRDWLLPLHDILGIDLLCKLATEKRKKREYDHSTDWIVEHHGKAISKNTGLDGFSKGLNDGQRRKNYDCLNNTVSKLRAGKFGQDKNAIRKRVADNRLTKPHTDWLRALYKSLPWKDFLMIATETKIPNSNRYACGASWVVKHYGTAISKNTGLDGFSTGLNDGQRRTNYERLSTAVSKVRAGTYGNDGTYGKEESEVRNRLVAAQAAATGNNAKQRKCHSTDGNIKAKARKKKPATTKKVSTTTTSKAAVAAAETESATESRSRRRSDRNKAAAKDSSSVGSDDDVSSNGSSSNQGRFNEGDSILDSNSKSDGDSDSNGYTNQAKEVRIMTVHPPPSSAPSTSTSTEEGVAASPTQEVSRSTAETLPGDKSRHEELNDADNDTNVDVVGVGELTDTDIDIDTDNESIDGDNEGGFDIGDNGNTEDERNPIKPTIPSNSTTNLDVEKRNNEVDHNSDGTIPLPLGSGSGNGNGDGDGVPPAYGYGGNRTNTNNNGSDGTLESPSSLPSDTGTLKRKIEKDPCLSDLHSKIKKLKLEKAELETQLEAESKSKAEEIAHQQQQHAEENEQQQQQQHAKENEQQRIRFSKLETQLKAESKSKAEEITHQQQQHAKEIRELEARNNEVVVKDNRLKTAVTTSTADPAQPSPSPPPIAASANANTSANDIQIKDSFRFQGKDKTRFNTLFNVEMEYVHNQKNGMNQVNFTGIAAMMNCERQKVMSHFYNSGREHEIKKGYI